jgi:hypothetical protein
VTSSHALLGQAEEPDVKAKQHIFKITRNKNYQSSDKMIFTMSEANPAECCNAVTAFHFLQWRSVAIKQSGDFVTRTGMLSHS